VAKFKYFGMIMPNHSYIHDEIMSRLKFMECLLPFSSESFACFLFENVNIKIYKTKILTVVLHGCGT
jgi:hypothetical protein